jgi:hypothetical protein
VRSTLPKGSDETAGLLSEQREFLKSRTEICSIPGNPVCSEAASRRMITCLKGLYTLRLNELQKRLSVARSRNAPPNSSGASNFAENISSFANLSSLSPSAFAAFDYSFTKNGPVQGIVKWYDFSVSNGFLGCVLHYNYRFGGGGAQFPSPCQRQCWVKEEVGSAVLGGINLDGLSVDGSFAGSLYAPGSKFPRGALHIPVGPRRFAGTTTCEGPAGFVNCGVVRPSQFEGAVSVDLPFKDINAANTVMSALKQAAKTCQNGQVGYDVQFLGTQPH